MAAKCVRPCTSVIFFLFVFLSACSTVTSQSGGCDCDENGSTSERCNADGECLCKPGVGGVKCDRCLPGYSNFSAEGCSPLCDCDPLGTVNGLCREEGGCQCHPRGTGDQCNACSFGYHLFDKGCLPCPSCFEKIATQFGAVRESYSQLFHQLNSLENGAGSGQNTAFISKIDEYGQLLEELIQKAVNDTKSEESLLLEYLNSSVAAARLKDALDRVNATLADHELEYPDLQKLLNSTSSDYRDLQNVVAALEVTVQEELGQLLEKISMLSQNLQNETNLLIEASNNNDIVSSNLQSKAYFLQEQITLTLEDASTALQQLHDAVILQNKTLSIMELVRVTLPSLREQFEQGQEALDNATTNVPMALMEAMKALEDFNRILLRRREQNSKRDELEELRSKLSNLNDSLTESDLSLQLLRNNFSSLNSTTRDLLTDCQLLDNKANLLLTRSQQAFILANYSVEQSNSIITEANVLLKELRMRFSTAQNVSSVLNEVLRNVEDAERNSVAAKLESETVAGDVNRIATIISAAVTLLENIDRTLNKTIRMAREVNIRSQEILSNSESLNSNSTGLKDEVDTVTPEVDALEEVVSNGRHLITLTTAITNTTTNLNENITAKLTLVKSILKNLTAEFNLTMPLPPGRLQEVTDVLVQLESTAEQNQLKVDFLRDEVNRLEESASALRERHTTLLQHQSLLQDILNNIQDLNCLSQFRESTG